MSRPTGGDTVLGTLDLALQRLAGRGGQRFNRLAELGEQAIGGQSRQRGKGHGDRSLRSVGCRLRRQGSPQSGQNQHKSNTRGGRQTYGGGPPESAHRLTLLVACDSQGSRNRLFAQGSGLPLYLRADEAMEPHSRSPERGAVG